MRELVFRAIRAVGERPDKRPRRDARSRRGRAGAAGAVRRAARPGAAAMPTRAAASRPRARLAAARAFAARSRRTNGRRCSSARRSTFASTSRERRATSCSASFRRRRPTPLSPWGIRLPRRQPGRRPSGLRGRACRGSGRRQPADRARLRASDRRCGSSIFAPAPAASRWRSPPLRQSATILATDSNRARLSKLAPRAERAGAAIETRLLNPPQGAGGARRLARRRRPRPGRCAMLGQRHLAAQSRGALAPDARAARPARRAPAAAARHRAPSWSSPADASSTPSARCCPAKGQGRLTASSAPFIVD